MLFAGRVECIYMHVYIYICSSDWLKCKLFTITRTDIKNYLIHK